MNQDIELLAPCGTYEAFLAAIENGANAVYLGGKLFNARSHANNFEIEELKNMVRYAHLRGVKVHVTLNTLLNNQELNPALDFAYDLYHIGVDAVIVQDLGLASILHEHLPDLELHASTQMTIHNLAGVQELKKLGFRRVVLSRELSFEEIKYICDNTDMDIEIFTHGALCISYSGECLMSSMIGDRSGNRGKCAQPCRLPYTLLKNNEEVGNGYLLSPKDLSMLEYLSLLPNVKSLKIEGRMKSPEYVAITVRTYRKYLDKIITNQPAKIDENDQKNLAQIFNRGGFTSAYLLQKQGSSMMCYERPKNWGIYIGKVLEYDGKRYIKVSHAEEIHIGDGIEIINGENTPPSTIVSEIENHKIGRIHGIISVGDKVYKTSDKELLKLARESFSRNATRKTNITMKVFMKRDKPVVIHIGSFVFESDVFPDKAIKKPLSQEDICKQFQKTGDSPFQIINLDIEMDDNLFLPVSILNDIRRKALLSYEEFFLPKREKMTKKNLLFPTNTIAKSNNKEVSLCVKELKKDYQSLKNVSSIYVPLREVICHEELFDALPFPKYILLPTITKANYEKIIQKNIQHFGSICEGFVLSNIGQLSMIEGLSKTLIANDTFNTFNDFTIQKLKELGFSKVVLSPELTQEQINALSSQIPLELMVYGYQVVMTSEHCPIGSIVGGFSNEHKCTKPCLKNDNYYLKDRLGMKFKVVPDNTDCQSQIYNSKITSIASEPLKIQSIKINVMEESLEDIQNIINIHLKGEKMSGEIYTNGHLHRPV